jgi:hypothetical protein
VTNDEMSSLRYYIAQLVRVWAALAIVRRQKSSELLLVFQDLCSDKLRNMLYELANKKNWTLGFSAAGTAKHKRFFIKLVEANNWFEGYKNRRHSRKVRHSRNVSGAHLQPLEKADHMFQTFGYGGEREWKQLTKGVGACVAMMKLFDGNSNAEFWRKIRLKVGGRIDESPFANIVGKEMKLGIPVGVEALLQSFKVEES